MHKIFIANESRQKTGGGWSWIANFSKGMGDLITNNYDEASIYFVPSASMIKPELAEQAKRDGKKVVLRTDNVLKHSRNEGKGMARMKRIAGVADLVVYQCQWAYQFLNDYLNNNKNIIIYNSVDLDVFKPEGNKLNFHSNATYLFASAAKNETKRWEWAWWCYQNIQRQNKNAHLLIAGNISTPVMQNNFDFFRDEKYTFLGMINNPETMASIYRSANYFFACAENDCYSNAILEAAMCGCELIEISMTGGTPELLNNIKKGREYNGVERMCKEYIEMFNAL